MRPAETSDRVAARLIEQVEAGVGQVVYRLQMPSCPRPSPCLVGNIYVVSGKLFVLFNITQKLQMTVDDVARQRVMRGYLLSTLETEGLPPISVSCDHRTIRPDGRALHRAATQMPGPGTKRPKLGEPIQVPALSW